MIRVMQEGTKIFCSFVNSTTTMEMTTEEYHTFVEYTALCVCAKQMKWIEKKKRRITIRKDDCRAHGNQRYPDNMAYQ